MISGDLIGAGSSVWEDGGASRQVGRQGQDRIGQDQERRSEEAETGDRPGLAWPEGGMSSAPPTKLASLTSRHSTTMMMPAHHGARTGPMLVSKAGRQKGRKAGKQAKAGITRMRKRKQGQAFLPDAFHPARNTTTPVRPPEIESKHRARPCVMRASDRERERVRSTFQGKDTSSHPASHPGPFVWPSPTRRHRERGIKMSWPQRRSRHHPILEPGPLVLRLAEETKRAERQSRTCAASRFGLRNRIMYRSGGC